ncbi:MAG: hypothetical protein R6U96_07565 [Promethearchaeia archaeon]
MSEKVFKIRINSYVAAIVITSAVFVGMVLPWMSLLFKAAESMPAYYTVIYSATTALFIASVFYIGYTVIFRVMLFNTAKGLSQSKK